MAKNKCKRCRAIVTDDETLCHRCRQRSDLQLETEQIDEPQRMSLGWEMLSDDYMSEER